MALAAALLVVASFNPAIMQTLRAVMREVTTPISSGLATVADGIAGVPAAVSDYFGVYRRNAELRAQVEAQREQIKRARMLAYDNRRLKALIGLRERTIPQVTAARLVSSSASSTRRYAILNAGFMQGVRPGQPVRGPEGLVGRVLEVGPGTARVLLLTDPESIVPVRRLSDGMPAIASGRGDGLIEIRPVNLSQASFSPGDVLVTSGTGGIYAPGIRVAMVFRRTGDTALAKAFARPDSFDFAVVDQAYMAMPSPPTEPRQ